jgi:hypothetical protein
MSGCFVKALTRITNDSSTPTYDTFGKCGSLLLNDMLACEQKGTVKLWGPGL